MDIFSNVIAHIIFYFVIDQDIYWNHNYMMTLKHNILHTINNVHVANMERLF